MSKRARALREEKRKVAYATPEKVKKVEKVVETPKPIKIAIKETNKPLDIVKDWQDKKE